MTSIKKKISIKKSPSIKTNPLKDYCRTFYLDDPIGILKIYQLTDKLIDEIISFIKSDYKKCYDAGFLNVNYDFHKFHSLTRVMTSSNPWDIRNKPDTLSSNVSDKYRIKWLDFYQKELPKLFPRINVNNWIKDWISSSTGKTKYHDLPISIEKYFVKPKKSTTVYRGMSFNIKNIIGKLHQLSPNTNFEKIKIGDTIECNFKDISSWSKDIKIATRFSIQGYNTTGSECFGIILETCANSKNSLLDISAYGILESQAEIIMKPGKYKCKIHLITNKINDIRNLSFGLYKDTMI